MTIEDKIFYIVDATGVQIHYVNIDLPMVYAYSIINILVREKLICENTCKKLLSLKDNALWIKNKLDNNEILFVNLVYKIIKEKYDNRI